MKKLLEVVGVVIGVLVGIIVLILILPYFFGLITKDISPPNASDLMFDNSNISMEDNMYFDLRDLIIYDYSEINYQDHIENKMWDQSEVDRLLSSNAHVFEALDRGISKPYYQNPSTSSFENMHHDPNLSDLNLLRRIGHISAIRALDYSKKGQHQEALNGALNTLELGYKIENSQIPFVGYLVAQAIKKSGLTALSSVMAVVQLHEEDKSEYIERLEHYKRSDGLAKSWKTEHAIHSAVVDYLVSEEHIFEGGVFKKYVERKGTIDNFYFRPNETRELFASLARQEILRSSTPCEEISSEQIQVYNDSEMSIFKIYLTENVVGKKLETLVSTAYRPLQSTRCHVEALISANQTLLYENSN